MIPYEKIPEAGREGSPHAVEVIMLGPTDDIGDLHTLKGRFDDGQAYINSYWKLNPDEVKYLLNKNDSYLLLSKQELLENLVIELTILGEGQPPVVLNVVK